MQGLFLLITLCLLWPVQGGKYQNSIVLSPPGFLNDNSRITTPLVVGGLPANLSSYGVIRLYLELRHNSSSDVEITLKNPAGTIASVANRGDFLCPNLFYQVWVYDDHGYRYGTSTTSTSCPTPGFSPKDSFSVFRGKALNGNWLCDFYDRGGTTETGLLSNVILEIEDPCYQPSTNCQNGATCVATGLTTNLCTCAPGWQGSDCTGDINECNTTNNCAVNSTCINTLGSYLCICNNGFAGDGFTCTDIDECADNPCGLNANCANTIGGFNCNCNPGFTGNGYTCTDINECTNNPCGLNATCNNTVGSYSCNCNPGFTGNGIVCTDINECTTTPSVCHSNATCNNSVGSYTCTCKNGFSGNGATCVDINECTTTPSVCHSNATCNNSVGSYTCTCKNGFSGNGISCTDINECTTTPSVCHSNATCTNTIGNYTCTCKPGYSGDGNVCIDVNECNNTPSPCNSDATCNNTVGSYTCTCKEGFNGDGFTCQDINECNNSPSPCNSNATCTNTIGSFSCTCNLGYAGTGFLCFDIDECTSLYYPCDSQAMCTNSDGSYDCQCRPGLIGDGHICTTPTLPPTPTSTPFPNTSDCYPAVWIFTVNNTWPNGFRATLSFVTPVALYGWRIYFDLPRGFISELWQGDVTATSSNSYSVTSPASNAIHPANGLISIEMVGAGAPIFPTNVTFCPLPALSLPPAPTPAGCSPATYTFDKYGSWPTGFLVTLAVTTPVALDGWTVYFNLPGGHITTLWTGQWSSTGDGAFAVISPPWNALYPANSVIAINMTVGFDETRDPAVPVEPTYVLFCPLASPIGATESTNDGRPAIGLRDGGGFFGHQVGVVAVVVVGVFVGVSLLVLAAAIVIRSKNAAQRKEEPTQVSVESANSE